MSKTPRKSNLVIAPSPRATKNPYEQGSRKCACFAIFARGGPLREVKKAMMATGITPFSADQFICFFRYYIRTGRSHK